MNDSRLIIGLEIGRSKYAAATTKTQIRNESVIAPYKKDGRALDKNHLPKFTLRSEGQDYVFGLNDIYGNDEKRIPGFGDLDLVRGTNTTVRYGSADWIMLLKRALLDVIPKTYINSGTAAQPLLGITIPIDQFNDEQVYDTIIKNVSKIKSIEDAYGNVLLMDISPKRILLMPEGQPAFANYAFNWQTLNPKKGSSTLGISLVVDTGSGTNNIPVFVGTTYQHNLSFTIENSGISILAKDVADSLGNSFNTQLVERALQVAAGIPRGKKKVISLPGNAKADVTAVYDASLYNLCQTIASGLLDKYKGPKDRFILASGGMYHTRTVLPDMLDAPVAYGDGELDNLYGTMIILKQTVLDAGKEFE